MGWIMSSMFQKSFYFFLYLEKKKSFLIVLLVGLVGLGLVVGI
jgi:hypothetical protein